MKNNPWFYDIIAIIILMACLFFIVKGVPVLMGGAHDATGAPVVLISASQSIAL